MLSSMKNSICGLALLLQILHKEDERWIVSKKKNKVNEKYKQKEPQLKTHIEKNMSFKRACFLLFPLPAKIRFSLSASARKSIM